MKVLVIGSGGREHALCWKLNSSPRVKKIFCAPGNPGTADVAQNVDIALDDVSALLQFAKQQEVDLTIVGPELPLTLGIADQFEVQGLRIFGPSKAAALLEGSKDFTKQILTQAGVPTAAYRTFEEHAALRDYLCSVAPPVVVKADGLASGKGVFVCTSRTEIDDAFKAVSTDLKSEKVVVEQFLDGVEASYIVATDGTRVIPMATSHDYKRLLDNQKGPNTGGMGAISPTFHLSQEQEQFVLDKVIDPVLNVMRNRGTPFKGFLYAGLMVGSNGEVFVLEFNARMGDPECQAIMRRLNSDLFDILWALSKVGTEPPPEVLWRSECCAVSVLAAAGYPANPIKGDAIFGLEQAQVIPTVVVFHAGTERHDRSIVTAGGRVLTVTALGSNIENARRNLYRAVDIVQFRGVQVRRDIGL